MEVCAFAPTPFKTSKTEAAGKRHKLDPGFKVVINGRSDGEKREELSIESQFLEHRTALISCTLDESGHAHFEVNSEPLSFKDSLIDTEHKYDLVGPLNFELNYFIYLSSVMSGVSVKRRWRSLMNTEGYASIEMASE